MRPPAMPTVHWFLRCLSAASPAFSFSEEGTVCVLAGWAYSKAATITAATAEQPRSKRFISGPSARRTGEDFEPPRRIRRAQFLGLLVPIARRHGVGGDADHLELAQHEGVVGRAE